MAYLYLIAHMLQDPTKCWRHHSVPNAVEATSCRRWSPGAHGGKSHPKLLTCLHLLKHMHVCLEHKHMSCMFVHVHIHTFYVSEKLRER